MVVIVAQKVPNANNKAYFFAWSWLLDTYQSIAYWTDADWKVQGGFTQGWALGAGYCSKSFGFGPRDLSCPKANLTFACGSFSTTQTMS